MTRLISPRRGRVALLVIAFTEKPDQFPFVAALRDIVRSNQKLKKLEHFKRRIDQNTGRMPYDIVYIGVSHTGRWAGSTYDGKGEKESGTNMQNLDNNSYEGIALRRLIISQKEVHRHVV